MRSFKCHPFPVVAHFERVVAVSFAFPEGILRPLVPKGLSIDCFEGLGFVTVAMVWTKRLRPGGFPRFLGRDFFLAGYRIFTRLEDNSGRSLRGLKIIRSETDNRFLVASGNLMTGYKYQHVDVKITDEGSDTKVISRRRNGDSSFEIVFDTSADGAELPEGSPFPDWRTARRFAGPMPFTFSPQRNEDFVVVEGQRGNWKPRPVAVKNWQIAFFDEEPFRGVKPVLANAFEVRDIAYRWEKGRLVKAGGKQ